MHERYGHIGTRRGWAHPRHHRLSRRVVVTKALFAFFVDMVYNRWRAGRSHVGRLLWRLVG